MKANNKNLMGVISILALLILFAGCTTTGTSKYDVDYSKYESVMFSENISVFDQKYLPYIAQVMERNGFKVTKTYNPDDTLICKLAIDQSSVWNFRVHISLWGEDEMLVVAETQNNGFGTLLASETSTMNLVNSALVKLEDQIIQATHP